MMVFLFALDRHGRFLALTNTAVARNRGHGEDTFKRRWCGKTAFYRVIRRPSSADQ
jgi:hypothetical protein